MQGVTLVRDKSWFITRGRGGGKFRGIRKDSSLWLVNVAFLLPLRVILQHRAADESNSRR